MTFKFNFLLISNLMLFKTPKQQTFKTISAFPFYTCSFAKTSFTQTVGCLLNVHSPVIFRLIDICESCL